MRYRLLFLDVDGTLLEPSRGLTADVHRVIRTIREAGVVPVIATGRPDESARVLAEGLGGNIPIVASGGAVGRDAEGRELWQYALSRSLAESVEAEAHQLGAQIYLYTSSGIFAHPLDTASERYADRLQIVLHPGGVRDVPVASVIRAIAVRLPENEVRQIELQWQGRWAGVSQVLQTVPTLLEVMPSQASKGHALQLMADHYGVARETCAAIGDGPGDRDMIQVAGCGAWVANADPSQRQPGDWVTSKSYTAGVEEFVRDLLKDHKRGDPIER